MYKLFYTKQGCTVAKKISLLAKIFMVLRDLEQTFVPNLLQHLECWATKLPVNNMADDIHGKRIC